MKTEVADLSAVKKRLTVEIPASDVAAVFDHLVRKYRKDLKVPGFRPGKAPLELVKARLGDDLEHEAADAIVQDFGREACRQEGLTPVAWDVETPDGTKHVPHPHEGEDYRFTLLLEVLPKIEPKDYVDLAVARPSVEVEVEEIQRELEALRQSKGKLVDIADRASEKGDVVGIEVEGTELGGEAKVPKEFRVVRLGDERNLPEFETHLAGKRPEEEFAFEVTYPGDLPDANLAGKTLNFRGVVKAVKKMDVPEWNDDLAREVKDGVKDFADLREQLKDALGKRKEYEADQVARQRLLDRVLDNNPFEVPQTLVEEELRDRLQRIGQRLASQGLDPDKLDIDWKKIIDDERVKAERAVREGAILDAIAARETEHVTVAREEVEGAIRSMARDMNETPAKLRQFLQREGRIGALEQEIRRSKCLDWIYSKAHIS